MNKKKKYSRAALLLLVLGAVMEAFSLLALLCAPRLLEYAICAPDVQPAAQTGAQGGTGAEGGAAQTPKRAESGLKALMLGRDRVAEQLGDAAQAVACAGMCDEISLSNGEKSAKAALVAADLCWLETCPRVLTAGAWPDSAQLRDGEKIVVLDEDLAFELFGSAETIGAVLKIEDADYRVVGTLRHARGVGEAQLYSAYIPLAAADAQGLALDTLVMYALPKTENALDQSFETAARAAWGEGSFYSLRKEIVRWTMLPRVGAFLIGAALLRALMDLLRNFVRRCRAQISQRVRHGYFRSWALPALLRALAVLLLAAALLLGAYFLLAFLIDPVYSFTEWVPESLVSFKALAAVFWNLVSENAQSIRVCTPETARLAFYGAFARWGVLLMLFGVALNRWRQLRLPKSDKR